MIARIIETSRVVRYIDPGTGSLIIQVIIAGLLGSTYFIRNYIRRFLNWLRKKK